jgi:hypothetical protein
MLGLVSKYLPLLQVAALIVASGILIIGITRELFDDAKRLVTPPGLDPENVTVPKYTTNQAEAARKYFRLLSEFVYMLLFTLLVILFVLAGVESLYLAIESLGIAGRAPDASCFGQGIKKLLLCEIATVAREAAEQAQRGAKSDWGYPIGVLLFYLLLVGSLLLLCLGMAVRTVVRIRANHSFRAGE